MKIFVNKIIQINPADRELTVHVYFAEENPYQFPNGMVIVSVENLPGLSFEEIQKKAIAKTNQILKTVLSQIEPDRQI